MKKTAVIVSLISIIGSAFGVASAATLSRDLQLQAASVKNPRAAEIARRAIAYYDVKCGALSDKEVRTYLDSDFHAIQVAVDSVLKPGQFEGLQDQALANANCVNFDGEKASLTTYLGIK